MKGWPLGAKLTAWSALIVGVAVLVCGIGSVAFIQEEQVEALDDQLRNEAHIFFSLVGRQSDDPGLVSASTVRSCEITVVPVVCVGHCSRELTVG